MLPTVEILGVTIAEPTTTVTDFMITAVAWWCAWRHARLPARRSPQRLWAAGFAFIGLAALLGGASHGAALHLNDAQSFYLWKATVYSVGLSMLFAFAGTLEGTDLPGRVRQLLHALNVGAFAVYAWWMLNHSDFVYVIFHYVPTMLGVAALQTWAWFRHRAPGAPWMVAGVMVTLLGAVVQQSGFTLHRHFNHNDLYHVIQIAGLALLFRGSGLLGAQDAPRAGTSGSRRASGLTNST